MLRKLFVITEKNTHGADLYLIREGGSQQHVIEIEGVSYTFGFGAQNASFWTDQLDAETFLFVNAEDFAAIEGAVFEIKPVYVKSE